VSVVGTLVRRDQEMCSISLVVLVCQKKKKTIIRHHKSCIQNLISYAGSILHI